MAGRDESWSDAPLDAVVDHVLERHRRLRRGLPSLLAGVDEERAARVRSFVEGLEDHLTKEELILLPALSAGRAQLVLRSIVSMQREHADCALGWQRITAELTARPAEGPAGATSSRPRAGDPRAAALRAQLDDFGRELRGLIELEEQVLYRRALLE